MSSATHATTDLCDAHEDAVRRDFTINGLFYDIDRKRVLDWVGGMDHIRARTVHTIGSIVACARKGTL